MMIEVAFLRVCWVKREAALPYSSILPVDSGVLMARKRPFSTPEGMTE